MSEADAAPRKKKPPRNPVSAEQRELFEQHLINWQDQLGLVSWRINFSEKKPPRSASADVECFHPDRLASIRLGADLGGTKVTSENLEALAIHELLHVLLAPLKDQVASGLEGESLDAYEHQVINTIQKLLTQGRI